MKENYDFSQGEQSKFYDADTVFEFPIYLEPGVNRTMTGIKILKIFLASSSELKEDREQFQIFIYRKTKEYIKEGIFLDLVIWEDFLDAMSATRLQDEYNKAITECDVIVSLFKTKVGQYTEEEVMTAYQTFKKKNKPLIYTYCKDFTISIDEINLTDLQSLDEFKKKLGELGHFYTKYKSIEDLKLRFDQQIDKFLPDVKDSLPEILLNIPEVQELRREFEDREQSWQSKISQLQKQLEANQQKLSDKESRIQELEQRIDNGKNSPNPPPTPDTELISKNGVDYTKLDNLLKAGKWQEANELTTHLMLQAANRVKEGFLTDEELQNFPCEDLLTIDQLWVHHSNGRFGFSVQKRIYINELGGTENDNSNLWEQFEERVGWRKNNEYTDLTFQLAEITPFGHLPCLPFDGDKSLLFRTDLCTL